jgi:serine/threonine-protein kinase RsbW
MPSLDGTELAVRYLPAGATADVGGDWYDAAVIADQRLVVTIGDVGGKGIAAAALMGRLRIGLKAYAIEGYSPSEIVSHLDQLTVLPERAFTTRARAWIDLTAGEGRLCRAGHRPPLLIPAAGTPRFVSDGGSAPVGIGFSDKARSETTLRLERGDAILLFTDGLVERRDRPIDVGFEQLAAAMINLAKAGAEAIADAALAARDRAGATPPDDIALLVIRFAPVAAAAAPGLSP